jgi:hypothetical protein
VLVVAAGVAVVGGDVLGGANISLFRRSTACARWCQDMVVGLTEDLAGAAG